MSQLLDRGLILIHPFVKGEIRLGYLKQRELKLRLLDEFPVIETARDEEVDALIERERLFGSGIGYVDAHLLASVLISYDASLWTRDKQLLNVSRKLSCAFEEPAKAQ